MKKSIFLAIVLFWGVFPLFSAPKVVSLSPAATELIFHLGKGDLLIGRSSACTYPEPVRQLPVFGDFARPDSAKILTAKPDLIITNDLIVPGTARTFEQHRIKVLFLPCRSIREYCDAIRILGRELGAEKAAEEEIKKIRDFTAECRKQPPLSRKVLTLIWTRPVITCGNGTFLTELLLLAGCSLPDFKGVAGYFKPSAGWLMNCGADTVLIFNGMEDPQKHPLLKLLPAVRKKRVILFPDDALLQRPGPRFFTGVKLLRRMLEK